MKLDPSDFDAEKYRKYQRIKEMSQEKLKEIKPLWNFMSSESILGYKKALPFDNSLFIECVDLKKLIYRSEFLGLSTQKLITDDNMDYSYVWIIENWEAGNKIDPPYIYADEGLIKYSDGRHRTIAAYYCGERVIPVMYHSSMARMIESNLSSKS